MLFTPFVIIKMNSYGRKHIRHENYKLFRFIKMATTKSLSVLAIDGCISSAITGLIDSLHLANIFWLTAPESEGAPLFNVSICSINGEQVTASGGIILNPENSIEDINTPDLIMVPAFLPPFDVTCNSYKPVYKWLKESYNKGSIIASTCTGTFLLAESGLLDGKSATTNWFFANKFRKEYPRVNLNIDKVVVEDQRLISSGAATAFMNLCLYFIEKFGSTGLASLCAKALLIDPDKQSQSPYMLHDFWKSHLDSQILEAQNWMENNFSNKISIDDIAENAGISPRHFKRRFKKATNETPIAYLQHLRIERAKHLLENSLDTINEITWQVGYEDINSFRRLFKKHTDVSPKEFRNKFARTA